MLGAVTTTCAGGACGGAVGVLGTASSGTTPAGRGAGSPARPVPAGGGVAGGGAAACPAAGGGVWPAGGVCPAGGCVPAPAPRPVPCGAPTGGGVAAGCGGGGASGEINCGTLPEPKFCPVPTYIGLRSAAVSSCDRTMCGVTIMTTSVCLHGGLRVAEERPQQRNLHDAGE